MKLSTRARYALRMMVVMARRENGESALVNLGEVAAEARVSRRYLEQLVIGLKNGALIRGKSGKGGGYSLARPADQIPLREIFESAIGQINIVDCVMQPDICLKSDFCECRSLYALINKKITSVLDSLYLSDLTDNDRLHEAIALLDESSDSAPCPEAH
jgi:Rrf2 family iron-sulfur cluster assembly transcriptional regulator